MTIGADSLVTLLQALQLVALAPCLFVVAYLLLTVRDYRQVIVPTLYFLSLACAFTLPLLDLWPQLNVELALGRMVRGGLIFTQSLLPALSFLLIMQFARGRIPALAYWGVLALPAIGGSGLVYASLLSDELCIAPVGCVGSQVLEGLYSTFSNAFIFLLLVYEFSRAQRDGAMKKTHQSRYWLIILLISLNVAVMLFDLLRVADLIAQIDEMLIVTSLRVTFIFLVLTLLFRVFDAEKADIAMPAPAKKPQQEKKDRELIRQFEEQMETHFAYREMECSRETVAKALDVHENQLSRIINQHYKARFTDVVNQYRVKEAQRLLVSNPQQAITDIAFEVGFSSIPSFNRVFKDSSGFSPSEYRNTHLSAKRR